MKSYNTNDIFDLTDKVVLVTGACGGLGRHYCFELACRGATLCITDRYQDDLLKLQVELAKISSLPHLAVSCDLTKENDVATIFSSIKRTLKRLDGVLNNAAATSELLMSEGNSFADFENYPLSLWEQVIQVNLTGSFLVARGAGKLLQESGTGSLVNVSSIYGIRGPDHSIYQGMDFSSFASYSASKSGLHGLTLWLATYWASKGVRVNTLVPGGVENNHDPVFVSRYSRRSPMKRMGTPRDMLGAAVFLLSDASAYVTGQQIIVDGGLSCW